VASADNAQLLLSIDATTELLRSEIAKGTAALSKFATQTEHDAERVHKSFERMGEKVKETALEFAKLGATILIGQSIESAIEKSIEYSETLVKTGQQLGVTTRFLQEFRFAAGQTATSAEAADKSLAKFSVTLGKAAEGNKTSAEAFSRLGVKIADSSGNLRPSEAIFRDVADAISKLKGPAEQSAAAVALFGRGGQSLLPILLAGANGFNKFAEEAEKVGLVLGEGTIERLEEVSNAARKVKQEISVELARIIGDNAEALFALGRGAVAAASAIGNLIQQYKGARFLEKNGDILAELTSSGDTLAALGTPKGQVKYAAQAVKNAEAKVAGDSGGLSQFTQAGQQAAAAHLADLVARREALGKARDELLAYNTPVNAFSPKEGDEGRAGGKVIAPKDTEGERDARAAAAEAARAQNEADRIAAAAEARLVTIKKELNSVDAQIIEEQAKLSTNPASRLDADIAGAKAKTDKLVADQKIEAGNDTTKAQTDTRTKVIADLKRLGDDQVAVIRDTYAREHALALQSINDENAQIDLANRAANVSLIKDDDARAEAEKQIASDSVDFQIAQIDRQIAASKTLTAEEISGLRKRQAELAAGKTVAIAQIDRSNQGPAQDYLDSIGNIDKALNQAAANGLKSFDDGITAAILHTKSLGGAFHDIANTIIADLVRIAVEKTIVGPLANALGLGEKSSGSGGAIASFISSIFHREGGGPVTAGQPYIVGEKRPELFVPTVSGAIVPQVPQPRSPGILSASAQRVDVHVHTSGEITASPLFYSGVASIVTAGNAQLADGLRKAQRSSISRGRG
jgi:hypothetical protein